ncbi:energy transducer TonB [Gelidibacter mesophilus]|uniref:energy transducer TonB n=1 Tax=Gelidibacter mesophilus TaxID=169050 RepID=UPI00040D8AB1|nr:energy transducer TonB [Gelidibacter mesophilus]
MKKFKNSSDVAGQSITRNVKPHKHDANLQKNSALYFQVGLILCLLISYGLFEMKFEGTNYNLAKVDYPDNDVEYEPEVFLVEQKLVKKPEDFNKKSVVLTKDPIIRENDFVEPKLDILTDPEPTNDPIDVDKVVVARDPDKDVEPEIFDVLGVEQVPIYPGCESANNNEERRACMSDKLSSLIKKKFNTGIAQDLGLFGLQKIYVQFKIDKSGNVIEILSRAPSQQLEDEAARVLSKVPQMVPGKQRHRPVAVMYSLPILFDVQ